MEDFAFNCEVESEESRVMDDDVKLALQRELIHLVQNHSFLFDKKMDGHADKDLVANTWDSIGLSLSKPMPGEDACKEFYKLRQRFGKEKRKVRRGKLRPGKGSAYVPNWVLFNDLEFLSDHIQARIRSSVNHCSPTAAQSVPRIAQVRDIIPGTPRNGLAAVASIVSSDEPMIVPGLSRFNFKVAPPRSSSPSSSRSVLDDAQSASGSTDNDPIWNTDFSTLEVPSDNSFGPTRVINEVEPKRIYKRRRQESGSFSQSVQAYSKQIKELAVKVIAGLEKTSTSETRSSSGPAVWDNFSPHLQAMLTSLGFAFLRIPEEDHLSCLIDILNIINTKYSGNHSK